LSSFAASNHGTCCEGQGTRLFGSLAEHVFSLTETGGVYIDLYTQSSIVWDVLANGTSPAKQTLDVVTAWPYGSEVLLALARTAGPPGSIDVALRIPAWVGAPVPVSVDGVKFPTQVGWLVVGVRELQ
jgi:DUF1680 family protein